jgi:hypothetical protein
LLAPFISFAAVAAVRRYEIRGCVLAGFLALLIHELQAVGVGFAHFKFGLACAVRVAANVAAESAYSGLYHGFLAPDRIF